MDYIARVRERRNTAAANRVETSKKVGSKAREHF